MSQLNDIILAVAVAMTAVAGGTSAAPPQVRHPKCRVNECLLADFTKDGNGWRAAHHIKDAKVSPEGLSITVTDNDPWLLGPKVTLPAAGGAAVSAADVQKRVPSDTARLRLAIVTAPTMYGGTWEIYHDFDGRGYDERKKFMLKACGSAPYTEFVAYLPAKDFAGLAGNCRLDPPVPIGGSITVRSFTAAVMEPLWSYRPATPPELVLPADAITLEGEGWRLRHDPVRMGAFRYESYGKTVEGCVGEPCVVASRGGRGATALPVDWGMVKATVKHTANGFTMAAETRDAEGRKWRMVRSFDKVENGCGLAIRTEYACDATEVFHVPYLTLFAERASNGH